MAASTSPPIKDDDDVTIVTSNTSQESCTKLFVPENVHTTVCDQPTSQESFTKLFVPENVHTTVRDQPTHKIARKWKRKLENRKFRKQVAANARSSTLGIPSRHAILDTGATGNFLMRDAPCINKQKEHDPITVNMPEGATATSSHICELDVPGLPRGARTGYIIPALAHASLIGVRTLCKSGCKVIFDDRECKVYFNNKIVLVGTKDPTTDLWVTDLKNPTGRSYEHLDLHATRDTLAHAAQNVYSIKTKQNAVKYMHQAMCSPRQSTLLNAAKLNFLKEAPHLSVRAITKYLPPAPATAKGHMKRPRQGLRSTTPKPRPTRAPTSPPKHEEGVAHVFCFGAFADKNTGVVYTDMTGKFPHMSLDGNVCYFVMYHYESNAILAEPIAGLTDELIFAAYKKKFEYLESKGFKMKVNIMDNQATKIISSFLTSKECKLQLVEPHNHRMNAAERAIETWKDHFISALCTTDSAFPVQLWDRLTPQAQDTLNLMRQSRSDPTKSAYEVLEGP